MSRAATKASSPTIDSFMPGDIVLARFGPQWRRARVIDVSLQFVQVRLLFDGTPEEDSPTSVYRPDELRPAA